MATDDMFTLESNPNPNPGERRFLIRATKEAGGFTLEMAYDGDIHVDGGEVGLLRLPGKRPFRLGIAPLPPPVSVPPSGSGGTPGPGDRQAIAPLRDAPSTTVIPSTGPSPTPTGTPPRVRDMPPLGTPGSGSGGGGRESGVP